MLLHWCVRTIFSSLSHSFAHFDVYSQAVCVCVLYVCNSSRLYGREERLNRFDDVEIAAISIIARPNSANIDRSSYRWCLAFRTRSSTNRFRTFKSTRGKIRVGEKRKKDSHRKCITIAQIPTHTHTHYNQLSICFEICMVKFKYAILHEYLFSFSQQMIFEQIIHHWIICGTVHCIQCEALKRHHNAKRLYKTVANRNNTSTIALAFSIIVLAE